MSQEQIDAEIARQVEQARRDHDLLLAIQIQREIRTRTDPKDVADYLLVPVTTLAQWRYLGQGRGF